MLKEGLECWEGEMCLRGNMGDVEGLMRRGRKRGRNWIYKMPFIVRDAILLDLLLAPYTVGSMLNASGVSGLAIRNKAAFDFSRDCMSSTPSVRQHLGRKLERHSAS